MITLMMQMNLAYPNQYQVNDEIIDFWYGFMKDLPFEKAQKHLNDHIKSSKYPPTIADIVRHDPNQFIDHDKQKLDTQKRLQDMEKRSLALSPITPERMEEIRRNAEAGVYDEQFKDDPYLRKVVYIGD